MLVLPFFEILDIIRTLSLVHIKLVWLIGYTVSGTLISALSIASSHERITHTLKATITNKLMPIKK